MATSEPFFFELHAAARAADNVGELAFSLANDTYTLLHFRQALVFDAKSAPGSPLCISGQVRPSEDSPYLVWLKRSWATLAAQWPSQVAWIEQAAVWEELSTETQEGWQAWWPAGLLYLPLHGRDGQVLAHVLFLADTAPAASTLATLERMAPEWAYAWEMLTRGRPPSLRQRWQGLPQRYRRYGLVALLCLLILPVRQTALAPAEVVSLDARVIAAPLDGVVKEILVAPNQPVSANQPLMVLDDTTLKNRQAVARKSLQVAEAEWQTASQKAFDSMQSKSELAQLAARVEERRADLIATEIQLARVTIVAPHAGIAVFADRNDWRGRPVVTGERIMLLADPAQPGILIHLPVADAVSLDPGAVVRLFLTVRPLRPVDGTLIETSYQANLSPDGVASYRLRARLDPGEPLEHVRIGLRGTARIEGGWVALGYYLLRRPLAALREWSGM